MSSTNIVHNIVIAELNYINSAALNKCIKKSNYSANKFDQNRFSSRYSIKKVRTQ